MNYTEKHISKWNLGRDSALIQSLEKFSELRSSISGTVIMTSGGMDPIHPGHLTSFLDAKRIFENKANQANYPKPVLIVVVNGDAFLASKKGRPFMDLKTRCQIVSFVRGVDIVIPFEINGDSTVRKAIKSIRPNVFAKGGDRTGIENIPEWGICKELGIEVVTGMGDDKLWSSSDFLAKWEKPYRDYIELLEAGSD
jgi:cytidyltransferase-like protein